MQNTHISGRLRALHSALIDIVAVVNRPQRDEAMIQEAGIKLDRALFPLLVLVERLGPIGVVELAVRVGRDYTTVSRQVAKLNELGLIARRDGAADKRVREAIVTAAGKAMTDRIDTARERISRSIFRSWDAQEIDDLVRLMRKLADAVKEGPHQGIKGHGTNEQTVIPRETTATPALGTSGRRQYQHSAPPKRTGE